MSTIPRTGVLALALAALASLVAGCGGTSTVAQIAAPDLALKVAAHESLTLRGIALDSCSAWRLVSLESTRNDRASADHYAQVAAHLADEYISVLARYETHRRNLGPVLFLPAADSLIVAEVGS